MSRFDIVPLDDVASAAAHALAKSARFVRDSARIVAPPTDGTLVANPGETPAGWVVVIEPGTSLRPDFSSFLEFLDEAHGDVAFADGYAPSGEVVRRPVHSPERLRCQYFWGPVVAYRASALRALGPLDPSMLDAQLYDLALRATRAGQSVDHSDLLIAQAGVAGGSPETAELVRRALTRHLFESGGGEVRSTADRPDGVHDTRRPVTGTPLVSIVIPSRGTWTGSAASRESLLLGALASIHATSTYPNYEVVVVADSGYSIDIAEQAGDLLGDRLRLVEWTQPFNFSDKVNLGVVHSRGEFILILNDDVEVLSPGWIEALLALAQLPNAGMSGAKLYFEDGSVQHAGHAYWQGDASHIGLDEPGDAAGPLSGYRVEREVAGVTAACAMMPRSVYDEVGGLTGLLPGAFNDVDLCMKTTWLGHDIYWTPHAELTHFESKSRDATVHAYEVEIAWGRWGFRMDQPEYWPYPLTRQPGGR